MESLFAAMGLVFLAELGDKTQLVALGFGARYRLAPVLLGVFLAYAASNLLSVLVGSVLGAALPTRAIGIGGGILFLGFALWNLRQDGADEPDEAGAGPGIAEATGPSHGGIVLSVAVAMFVAELGDKTMLATATLAAQGNPVLVWIGATVGICLSGAVGVLVGRSVGARLPDDAIRIGSSVLFAVFGLVLIATNV
jgi:putative Ca2+/H+ antiporter (TMEM165/GDT1 family)